MKKIFFIFLFLSCIFGALAETGYNGLQWNITKNQLRDKRYTKPYSRDIEAEKKSILGEGTKIFYHFPYDELIGVSYTIQKSKTKKLIAKYNKDSKIDSFPFHCFSKKELEENMEDEIPAGYTLEDQINTNSFMMIRLFEMFGIDKYKSDPGNGKGTVHIYDYNDDTRVYIFENIVEGLTLMYYTYHEQDY